MIETWVTIEQAKAMFAANRADDEPVVFGFYCGVSFHEHKVHEAALPKIQTQRPEIKRGKRKVKRW